jgi:hypothetical protein
MTETLVAALARAQATVGKIGKGHENKHFGSSYADIADVLAVVRPALAAEGIAVSQPVRITERGCELVTVLLKGDERMESAYPMPTGLKPQDTLSWLTYMRRGLLCALVGVAPEGEDDDGNAANTASKPKPKAQTSSKVRNEDAPIPTGEALSFDELAILHEYFEGLPDEVRAARKKAFAGEFGTPQQARRDQWPAIEAWIGQ